jgi:hypothetical protein
LLLTPSNVSRKKVHELAFLAKQITLFSTNNLETKNCGKKNCVDKSAQKSSTSSLSLPEFSSKPFFHVKLFFFK